MSGELTLDLLPEKLRATDAGVFADLCMAEPADDPPASSEHPVPRRRGGVTAPHASTWSADDLQFHLRYDIRRLSFRGRHHHHAGDRDQRGPSEPRRPCPIPIPGTKTVEIPRNSAFGHPHPELDTWDQPFTGNGFTKAPDDVVPEWRTSADSPLEMSDGAELFEARPDGSQRLVAVLRAGSWERVT